jgi:DNA-binding MarR family transcriptional regulator
MKDETPSLNVAAEADRPRHAAASAAATSSLACAVNRPPQLEDLQKFAAKFLALRAARKTELPATLFGEPGFDMLLALYCHQEERRLTVTNMYPISQVPDTTALRWIDRIIELGLIRREPNPVDARVYFLELEPAGRAGIENYLLRAWNALFSP